MDPRITKATVADAIDLAPRLREADRRETYASLGFAPEVALPMAIRRGAKVWTARAAPGGPPVAVFGVDAVPCFPDLGIVWALGSDDLSGKCRRAFLQLTPSIMDMLHDHHPLLGNYVDARSTAHLRWLRWAGFSFLRLHPKHGVEQRPFIQFARIRT